MSQVDTSIHSHPTGRALTLANSHSGPQPPSQPTTGPPQNLILYGGWFCPFVQRVWIVLREKGINHEYREVNPYRKEQRLLELNPRGLVPTLEIVTREDAVNGNSSTSLLGSSVSDWINREYQRIMIESNGQPQPPTGNIAVNRPKYPPPATTTTTSLDPTASTFTPTTPDRKALNESTVIVTYLNDSYNLSLLPSDPYTRAQHNLQIHHISTSIVPAFYRFLQHTPEKNYSLDSARLEFVRGVYGFAEKLPASTPDGGAGPWFGGGREMGMVDIILIPWACRIFLLDHYKGGSGIPEEEELSDERNEEHKDEGIEEHKDEGNKEQKDQGNHEAQKAKAAARDKDTEIWKRWRRWYQAVEAQASVQDTMSERERYVDVYKRYAEDTTGSMVGQATRGGRGLP